MTKSNVTELKSATTSAVYNPEGFEQIKEAVVARLQQEWNMMHVGLREIPEGTEPSLVSMKFAVNFRKMQKDSGGELSLDIDSEMKIKTVKTTGSARIENGQMVFNYFGTNPNPPEPENVEETGSDLE